MANVFFHIRKIATIIYVFIISKIEPWKKVEGIFLPVKLSIGYNVLRWILNGEYEQGEINIIKNRLEKDDIVLEIGSGLGFISSYCAKRIGNNSVFTFEANPENIEICKAVFNKNKVAPIIENAMLTNEQGVINFSINSKNRLGSSVYTDSNTFVEIPALKLNDKIKEIKPGFLIMDIEGAEFNIFSIIDFQSIKKIQFELHPDRLGEEKCSIIFKIIESNGFMLDQEVSIGDNYYYYK